MSIPAMSPTAPAPQGSAPLDRPLYGATISQAFVRFWKKYVVFSGRASRSEYWWVALLSVIISAVLSTIGYLVSGGGDLMAANRDPLGGEDILSNLWALATVVPSLALSVRRLHDINRSGWWVLIALIPLIGWIVLIVFHASRSVAAGARYDVQPAR